MKRPVSFIMFVILQTATLLIVPCQLVAQEYPPGMVSYWKFDEPSGDIAYDEMGLNDGSIWGAARTSGKVANCLSFDGIDDFVQVIDDDSLDFHSPGTIEAWIRRATSSPTPCCFDHRHIILKSSNFSSSRYANFGLFIRGATPQGGELDRANFYFGDGYGYNWVEDSNTVVTKGSWHHIAVTWDGAMISMYIDGILDETAPQVLTPSGGDGADLLIGHRALNADEFWAGEIDEVALYSRELSFGEVQSHYQAGLNGIGYELVPQLSCLGFEPPLGAGTVLVKQNKVVPLKAVLYDEEGTLVTDQDLAAPPVVEVDFASGSAVNSVEFEFLPAGLGTDGNEFVCLDGKWHFNLKVKDYTAGGTYLVRMVAGDSSYTINPTCSATFTTAK